MSPRFRRALWIALAVNAAMFAVEVAGGWYAGSVSLLAALGVFGTASAWPDLVVAAIMALLALTSSMAIVRMARIELSNAAPSGATV